jgi:hypothetical protein
VLYVRHSLSIRTTHDAGEFGATHALGFWNVCRPLTMQRVIDMKLIGLTHQCPAVHAWLTQVGPTARIPETLRVGGMTDNFEFVVTLLTILH